MICEQARLCIGGEPNSMSSRLNVHLRGCPECQAFHALVLAFEPRLRRALELELTAPGPSQLEEPSHRPNARRWRALTAGRRPWPVPLGLAAAVLAGLCLWAALRPPQTLTAQIIQHVEDEPASWTQTRPVSPVAIDAILHDVGFVPRPIIASVVYARACDFRGHRVAHFVVTTESGPVAVMMLARESVNTAEHFQFHGYRAVLLPLQGGSIAVVSYSDIALRKTMSDLLRSFQVASNRTDGVTR